MARWKNARGCSPKDIFSMTCNIPRAVREYALEDAVMNMIIGSRQPGGLRLSPETTKFFYRNDIWSIFYLLLKH